MDDGISAGFRALGSGPADHGFAGVEPGRKKGQSAPTAKPQGDRGGRPMQPQAAARDAGPISIPAPGSVEVELLRRFGRYPSANRPDGAHPELMPGVLAYNPFEGRWIE